MKSLFSTIMNNALFNFAKRLAMAVVLLSFAGVANAAWTAMFTASAKIASVSTGEGTVYVSNTEITNPTNLPTAQQTASKDGEAKLAVTSDEDTSSPKTQLFYWLAKAKENSNSTFVGWYDNNQCTGTAKNANFNESLTAKSSSSSNTSKTYYALFKKIIDPKEQSISWTPKTADETREIQVDLCNATNLSATIEYNGGENTTSFDCAIPKDYSPTGSIKLICSTGGGIESGSRFVIKLSADGGGYAEITVEVLSDVKVTFKSPSGGGSFTATQTGVDGTPYTLDSDAPKIEELTLTKSEEFYFELDANAKTGYDFLRWVITDKEGKNRYIYYDDPSPYTAKNGDEITAEFLGTDYAQFVVKGVSDKYYYLLDDAIEAANSSSSKVVVVSRSGKLYTGHKELKNGKYEFTIHAGITLLVPGDAAYTVTREVKDDDNLVGGHTSASQFSYLTLLPYTRIISHGDICVFSKISYEQRSCGMPNKYGEIVMNENTEIIMKNGSYLTCFGYISGDPTTSFVEAESGATIHEAFQMRDWRGGSVATELATGDNKKNQLVFVVGQYYVQSIETKLILNHGATEYVFSCVAMTIPYVNLQVRTPLKFPFITQSSGGSGTSDEGFLCLRNGTRVEKWYDYDNDKQVYIVEGTDANAEANFGNMVMSISGTDVQSKDYVLPITNNIDITMKNIKVTSFYDMAMLADSKLEIEKGAELVLIGECFVYDKEVHSKDFFYDNTAEFYPVKYTTRHKKAPSVRKWDTMGDAQIVVNGKITVKAKEANGQAPHGTGFYTTGLTDSDEKQYGAMITSTGGGVVDFQVIGSQANTFQYNQNAKTFINIPVTNARLRNGDGTWAAGHTVPEGGEEYIYSASRKEWVTPKDGVTFDEPINNTFTVTLPNVPEVIQDIQLLVINGEDDGLTISDFDISWPDDNAYFKKAENAVAEYNAEDGIITMPIAYIVSGIDNHEYNHQNSPRKGELVVSYEYTTEDGQDQEESITIKLSAIENYTPDFTVDIAGKDVTSNGTHSFIETLYGKSDEASLVITPAVNNVAGLEGVEWSIVPSPNPPFSVNESKMTVVYTPAPTVVSNEGTLTIQATYTDEAGKEIPSKKVEVTLNGTPRMKDPTLKFKEDLSTMIIYQTDIIDGIFEDTGNGMDIDFEYWYANDRDASELVRIDKNNTTGNYTLTALLTDYVDDRTLTIRAIQGNSNEQYGATREVTITIKPLLTWNWSNLHFGKLYTNSPVTFAREGGDWTLSLTKVPQVNDAALLSLSGSTPDYAATVGVGEADEVYEAEFTFEQNNQSKTFKSKIFADPRVLGFCVNYDHQFEGVSTNSSVTFEEKEGEKLATTIFPPGKVWEINMTGIPKTLHFNVTGNNTWYIAERSNSSTSYQPIVNRTKLIGEQAIQLQPTTNQVMIQYGSAEASNGTISGLCIDELDLSSNHKIVYFPIYKNDDETSKEVLIRHTAPEIACTIDENSGFTISPISLSDTKEISTDDENESYYQTTITIKDGGKNDIQKVGVGAYTLTVTQGDIELNIPVYADVVPQGLPIRLAEDDVKRYHFIATESELVTWNAPNVIFLNPGTPKTRMVTFTFEGAPSRIMFDVSQTIKDGELKVYESEKGDRYDQVYDYSIDGKNMTFKLKYTTRYVHLKYYSENNISEFMLSNLVIEGDPMLLVNPEELEFSDEEGEKEQALTLTTINLNKIKVVLDNVIDFKMSHEEAQEESSEYILTSEQYPDALGKNKVGDIVINTEWISQSLANDGLITIYNILEDNSEVELAKVKLVAAGKYIRLDNANMTGIYTGIPDGTRDRDGDGNPDVEYKYTYHGKDYNENNTSPYTYHEVNLTNAFAPDGTALFDYLFVYGETTTKEGESTNITAPAGELGSNARTPLHVYVRDFDAHGNFDRYRHAKTIDDVNVGKKPHIEGVTVSGNEESTNEKEEQISVPVNYIPVGEQLSVYITGFAPYATTGYTKGDEGVFFFRGEANSKLHVYLEDTHIFARNKMETGQPFYTRGDKRNPTFSEKYARGSGGVLVFECVTETEQIDYAWPFEVSIHTIGNNLLKSNYGCFNYFFGMDPFQISAPIHVRLHSANHVRMSKTTVNFDDIWPTKLDEMGQIIESKRTNGFLGLKKLNNNAPSIDLGNPYTTVNFNGGQVQLQNAQIVSTNYKTTLAISYRSGEYGGDKVGLKFAYGIGTDSVGGTVNFNDGTITIEPMWVKEEYKNYYFIDKDENGNEIKKKVGTVKDENDPTKKIDIYEYQTTCLRCPKNTYVYGGSICWLRACQHVTSKGGAPMGGGGIDVGQYIYEFKSDQGDKKDENTQLVTSIQFPADIQNGDGSTLESYFNLYYPKNSQGKGEYGIKSITPDENNQLYFWIPEGYGGVSAEKDKFLTTWKACMTEISAGMQGITGTVGGNTAVEKNEEIKYMLYCQIDENISNVITAGTGEGDNKIYSYSAPVKVPNVAQAFYGSTYTQLPPTSVGDELQNEVISEQPYEVTDKVFYITTATADVWQTFTAPFDVAKIWVVETYSEAELEKIAKQAADKGENARDVVMLEQAEHNADFAAFFGVAMAIGTSDPLETIFNDFKAWGEIQDKKDKDENNNSREPLYNGTGPYTLRDRHQLIPYNGSNWSKAHFYLNHNTADWGMNADGEDEFTVHWELPAVSDDGTPTNGILMEKGETYSMLFPYCTGCFDENAERNFWDYWSGKFLIFESVDYSNQDKAHIIEGSDYLKDDWTEEELDMLKPEGVFVSDIPEAGNAKVTGNSTFTFMETSRDDIYVYSPDPTEESFKVNTIFDPNTQQYVPQLTTILPTTAFLWANIPPKENMPARGVMRSGEIIYDKPDDGGNGNQNGTSGHIPTVGGGNDMFITAIEGGINIAVAAPQMVKVMSSTGAVLFAGYVTTATDVQLPTHGIYIVSGENEVQKIMH